MNSVHISYLKNRDSLIVTINLNGLLIETNHPDTHFENDLLPLEAYEESTFDLQ